MTVIDFPATRTRRDAGRSRREASVAVRAPRGPALLTIRGEVDATKEAQLSVALRNYAAVSKPLIVDISGADFLSISVLRVLLVFNDYCHGVGATWALIADNPSLRRTLSIVDPDNTLPLTTSVGDVLPVMTPGTERC